MFDMKRWMWFLSGGILYWGISFWYWYSLKALNVILLKKQKLYDWSALELLGYNNYQALKYFGYALLLIFVGGGLGYFIIHLLRFDFNDTLDILIGVIVIFLLILFIIHTITLLTLPILKAIGTVLLGLIFWAWGLSSKG